MADWFRLGCYHRQCRGCHSPSWFTYSILSPSHDSQCADNTCESSSKSTSSHSLLGRRKPGIQSCISVEWQSVQRYSADCVFCVMVLISSWRDMMVNSDCRLVNPDTDNEPLRLVVSTHVSGCATCPTIPRTAKSLAAIIALDSLPYALMI